MGEIVPDNPSVIVGSPVSYKLSDGKPLFTAVDWLLALQAQDYPGLRIFALCNDLRPEMLSALRDIREPMTSIEHVGLGNPPDERKSKKRRPYQQFATVRNMVLDRMLETDADDWVSIDSDVIVHPDMVTGLVRLMEEKPDYGLIAGIVNNTRRESMKLAYGRATYNFGRIQETSRKKKPKCRPLSRFQRGAFLDVEYTGACGIMRMSMIREHSSVRFGAHRQGEDLFFCERVREAGFKIGVDTTAVTLHQMDDVTWRGDVETFQERNFQ
jgi:hypothetical protein